MGSFVSGGFIRLSIVFLNYGQLSELTSTRVQTGNHFFPLGGENGICPNCWTSADEEGVCCEGDGN